VVVHFAKAVDRGTRRWMQMCGFHGSGDGATFWRRRTFRRGENMGLIVRGIVWAGLWKTGANWRRRSNPPLNQLQPCRMTRSLGNRHDHD